VEGAARLIAAASVNPGDRERLARALRDGDV
jgi:hypothetical protein